MSERRRFNIGDHVHIDRGEYACTVVGYVDEAPEGPAPGTGPLYLLNDGNVFSAVYEFVAAESELREGTTA